MWFITLLLGVFVLWLISCWVNTHFTYWERKGIPHSKSTPFRMLIDYLFTKKTLTDIQKEYYTNLDGHSFAGYFQVFTPTIMIRDPELVHRICVKDFSHFVDRNAPITVTDLFARSLFSATGNRWRTLRQKMTPAFTSGKLKMMFTAIKECSDEALDFIDKRTGQDFEARDLMFKFVVNVVGNVSFGLKVDALNEENEGDNEFLNVSKAFFKPSFTMMVKFMITMTMPKVSKFLKLSMVDVRIDRFFRRLVKDMIVYRKTSGETRNDFLQLMLNLTEKEQSGSDYGNNKKFIKEAEEPEDTELLDQLKLIQDDSNHKSANIFSDDCIVSQTVNFISAGSESTAATLCFVLYELSVNPSLQKKVQEEIDNVLSKSEFDYEAIRKLKYMEQFIYETIRLHSVFQFNSRLCTQDYKVPGTDVILEKGTFILIPTTAIQNDAQYFVRPNQFDPDRFGEVNEIPGISIGFGCGPRMCIAKRLAMLQMKVFLATLLRTCTVSLSEKTQLPMRLMKSTVFRHVVGGVWVKFQRRI